MCSLKSLLDDFWEWTGTPRSLWGNIDISKLSANPQYYPKFEQLRNKCILMINKSIDTDEYECFLLSMALDNEEEKILDCCKEYANSEFIEGLVSTGISCNQWEARWQIAELLQRQIPNRIGYLHTLCNDANEYVRKRAMNVMYDIEG